MNTYQHLVLRALTLILELLLQKAGTDDHRYRFSKWRIAVTTEAASADQKQASLMDSETMAKALQRAFEAQNKGYIDGDIYSLIIDGHYSLTNVAETVLKDLGEAK